MNEAQENKFDICSHLQCANQEDIVHWDVSSQPEMLDWEIPESKIIACHVPDCKMEDSVRIVDEESKMGNLF